uniref:HKT11 transporter n=1 Tax=Leersia perrieri TaxID=77586 RepID=A0A0D9W964_9ORYZ
MKLTSLSICVAHSVKQSYSFLVYQSNPLVVQLIYFVIISFVGFLALKNLKPQGKPGTNDLDLMFTSVSALTVSSMATIEMEDLSDRQLWVLILLMLLGGEVFISMLGLYFNNADVNRNENRQRSLRSISMDIESNSPANNGDHNARGVLKSKEINMYTFCIFEEVSSFVNCGFTPLNSNMQPFRKNWVLLLLVIPQILAGNTLFSPLLRLSVWILGKISTKEEYAYILQHPEKTGYKHLHVQRKSVYMVLSVTGLALLQVMFICSFEWNSKTVEGMHWLQKLVGSLFQSVNTRQAGESVVDISTLSPPTLLLFAVIMLVPPSTPVSE